MTELERCELAKERGFTYDPVKGELMGVRRNVIITKNANGYIDCSFCINYKKFVIKGHRLAWYLHYGQLPKNHIDHIDGDRLNNRISNLRDVTQQQNNWNNTAAKGYSLYKKTSKYKARILINGNDIHLGYFNTEQEARKAYLKAKEKHHIID
jgi:hypothetical protein